MTFLYPNFLYFFFALGIPIVIHLFNFRRYKRIDFTNVQLLRDIDISTRSVKKLKNLLILISRLLALSFLILAFSQPVLKGPSSVSTGKQTLPVIYVDNSLSMSLGSAGNTAFDIAKEEAISFVENLENAPELLVLSNDFSASSLQTLSRKEAIEEINEIELSNASRNLSEILERAKNFEGDFEQLKLYLFSDFQKSQFDFRDLPRDSTQIVNFIKVNTEFNSNLSIDTCWSAQGKSTVAGIDSVYFRISNYSDKAINDQPVRLFVNAEQVSMTSVNIPAWTSTTASIPFDVRGFGSFRCRLSTSDEGMFEDDELFFSFETDSSKTVYFIGDEELLPYFRAVYKEPMLFRESRPSNVDIELLNSADLFLVDAGSGLTAALRQELRNRLTEGANLVLFCKDRSALESCNETFSALKLEEFERFNEKEIAMSTLNENSGILSSAIVKMPENPNLPKVKGFFDVKNRTEIAKEVILEFPGRKPALLQYKVEKGFAFVYCMPLDKEESNLLMHPIFVPLSINMAFMEDMEQQMYHLMGSDPLIRIREQSGSEEMTRVRNDRIDFIPETRRIGKHRFIALHGQIEEAGNYGIYDGEKEVGLFSLNYQRSESNPEALTSEDLSEITQKLYGSDALVLETLGGDKVSEELLHPGLKNLWKYCVILALMFFVAEILIIKFYQG